MSVHPSKATVVRCDHPGCPENMLVTATDLPVVARTVSTGAGWTAKAQRDRWGVPQITDLCPDHRTHQSAPSAPGGEA